MEGALQGWPRPPREETPVHATEFDLDPDFEPPTIPVERYVDFKVERRPKMSRGKLIAMFLGLSSLSPCSHVGQMGMREGQTAAIGGARASQPVVVVERSQAAGPSAPSDEQQAQEFMSEIGGDQWIHPLAGPVRRMPIRTSRVFGATRDGDRPGECRSGHCGVDIGGEQWGEPIMAVHDGVIDRVKRVDEGRGGMYVRIAHRDGKVFSQYFHLAAIPRHIREGVKVKAGTVIGLLGDTGVKESEAHLHFAISVKPSPTAREIYMDPEPLIALWPLKVPRASGGADVAWEPGVPLGAAGRVKLGSNGQPTPRKADMKRKRKRAASSGDEGSGEDVDDAPAVAASPKPAGSSKSSQESSPASAVTSPFAAGAAKSSDPGDSP
jgi:murein DD-endopeptidase MepM/ murein hydrolase activator NlpD